LPQITDQNGNIITTESGLLLTSDVATTNYDIQQLDFSVNLLSSLLWEYSNATNLQSIIQSKQDWFNSFQEQFWNDWITNVFNLQTANAFGLEVWSIILGQPLYINTMPSVNNAYWGFGANRANFTRGNFASANGGSINLPLATNRLLLQLRAFQINSSGTVPEINRFLKFVFAPWGTGYLQDNGNMTQEFIFNFPITWDLQFVFELDLLPRPSGVSSTWTSP